MFGSRDLQPQASYRRGYGSRMWGGEKFLGGLGPAYLNAPDYWELRVRSADMFGTNLYARGLVRRLVTNEISTGLMLEADPLEQFLPSMETDEAAQKWAEDTEARFELWADSPAICDREKRRTFAELQAEARREALVEGDILVRLHVDAGSGLPSIELIRGGRVRTPMDAKPRAGNEIIHGVEVDAHGVQVAFHVIDDKSPRKSERIPAVGARTGRRMAWMMYGTDKRMDAVRGEPLLSIVLQSIKELDRYRDSEQRAATVNALLAMYIQKGENLPGTRPWSGGAIRNETAEVTDTNGGQREFNVANQVPGVVFEELQQGEIPVSFNTSRPNVNYGTFEASVLHAIAWACQVPPEILLLAFSNNYSASKAAINEFKMYLTRERKDIGTVFCQPIYEEWLKGEVLRNRIQAKGLLESRGNPSLYVEYGAWTNASWSGPVKPSVDLGKDVAAYRDAISAKLTTHNRASKDLFGVRFPTVLRMLTKEMRQIRAANDELGISNEVTEPSEEPAPNQQTIEAVAELVLAALQEEQVHAHANTTH